MNKLNEIEIEKVKIDDMIIDVKKLRDKFDNREWKAYLLFDYDNNIFNFRKELEIIEPIIPNGEIIIKLPVSMDSNCEKSRIKLCKGIAKNNIITNLKLYVNNNKCSTNQYDLFKILDNDERDIPIRKKFKYKNENISEYVNSLFRIYYNHIKYYISNFNNAKLDSLKKGTRNKAIAMASYLSIRNYINYRYKEQCVVSEANVFIKNIFTEYDFLILKKDVKINQGYYEPNDVYAAVEIKTSGFFPSNSQNIVKDFNDLIVGETTYIDVPLIYIAIHEGSSCGNKKEQAHYFYEECLNVIKKSKKKVYGLFIAIKVGNHQFIVPYDFDFDSVIREIIK